MDRAKFCSSHKKHDCKECTTFALEKCLYPLTRDQIHHKKHRADVIIIGSGTAGTVLANRLSKESKCGKKLKVLVIEAGIDDVTDKQANANPADPFPQLIRPGTATYYSGLIHSEYQYEHEAFVTENGTIPGRIEPFYYSRGSTIGGSTSHHFGVHFSTTTKSAKRWTDAGNNLWSFEDQIRALKKVTNKGQVDWQGKRYFDPAKPVGSLGSFNPAIDSTKGKIQVVTMSYIMPIAKALGVSISTGAFAKNPYPSNIDLDDPGNPIGLGQQVLSNYDQFGTEFSQLNPYVKFKVELPAGVKPEAVYPNYPEDFGPLVGLTTRFMRSYAATGYYYPVRNRSNLQILTNRIVIRLLFSKKDKTRVKGVEYWEAAKENVPFEETPRYLFQANRNLAKGFGPEYAAEQFKKLVEQGKIRRAVSKCNVEVILSSGAIMTPHILMHSGIGPFEVIGKFLNQKDLVTDLAGVGRGLKDHPEFTAQIKTKEPIYSVPYFFPPTPSVFTAPIFRHSVRNGADFIWQIVPQNISDASTLISGPNGPWSFYKGLSYKEPGRVNPKWQPSQIQPTLQPMDLLTTNYLNFFGGIYDGVQGEGHVEIISSDPLVPPKIVTNYLQNRGDADAMVEAFFEVLKPAVEQLLDPDTYFQEAAGLAPINPNGTFSVPPKAIPGGKGFFEAWIDPPPKEWLLQPKIKISSITDLGGNRFLIEGVSALNADYSGLINGGSVLLQGISSPSNLNGFQLISDVDDSNFPQVFFTVKPNYPISGPIVVGEGIVAERVDKDGFLNHVKRVCEGHHASCTARMGLITDYTTVIDQRCRVYNIKRLRVVDASSAAAIWPAPTAPMAYMIGERASELIREEYEALHLL